MSKVACKNAIGDELLDVTDPLISRAFEFFEGECRAAVGVRKLLGSPPRIPLRLERPKHCGDLLKIHPVRALVRTSVGAQFQSWRWAQLRPRGQPALSWCSFGGDVRR